MGGGLLVQNIELFCRCVLLQKLAGHFPLGSKNNAILCQYPKGRSSMRDGFECIFNLVKTPFWREDCSLGERMMVSNDPRSQVESRLTRES